MVLDLCDYNFRCFNDVLERFNSPPGSPNDYRGFADHTLDRVCKSSAYAMHIFCDILS